MSAYLCAVCENWQTVIPLLEDGRTTQHQNPPEFQATCLRCKQGAAFDESEIEPP